MTGIVFYQVEKHFRMPRETVLSISVQLLLVDFLMLGTLQSQSVAIYKLLNRNILWMLMLRGSEVERIARYSVVMLVGSIVVDEVMMVNSELLGFGYLLAHRLLRTLSINVIKPLLLSIIANL